MTKKVSQYFVILCLVIFLTGCNAPAPTPVSQTELKPLLVQPQDVGWPDNSYFEGESVHQEKYLQMQWWAQA